MKRLVLILAMLATPLFALDPSEMMDDPALEARARVLDFEIRCIQCQSEAVASSNAAWARDARRAIRDRISAGDSDAEVKEWFRTRYGDFVLMDPPKSGTNLALWVAGPVLLLIGLMMAGIAHRSRKSAQQPQALSDAEKARLAELTEK